jgi:hypothetical protein
MCSDPGSQFGPAGEKEEVTLFGFEPYFFRDTAKDVDH